MQMFNELSDVTCSNSISVYISQQLSRAHCTPTFAGTNKCHSLSNKPFILSIKTDRGGVSIGKVQRLMCGYSNTRTVPMASANLLVQCKSLIIIHIIPPSHTIVHVKNKQYTCTHPLLVYA